MTIPGQLDILDLITLQDHDTPATLDTWAANHGITLRTDSPTRGTSVYPGKGGPRTNGTLRPFPDDPLRPQWSGYAIPPQSTQTVAQANDYYLPRLEESEGMPISGDELARWGTFQDSHAWKCFPRYRDIWPVLYGSEPPATRASTTHADYCDLDHHPEGAR